MFIKRKFSFTLIINSLSSMSPSKIPEFEGVIQGWHTLDPYSVDQGVDSNNFFFNHSNRSFIDIYTDFWPQIWLVLLKFKITPMFQWIFFSFPWKIELLLRKTNSQITFNIQQTCVKLCHSKWFIQSHSFRDVRCHLNHPI